MLCIYLKEKDPWFCLAAEEYLLKNYTSDIFILWQSDDAVISGKHQNILAEINYRYVREHQIALARRISGGGTVFHDRGNVNFTYIKNVSGPHEISFSRFTEPIRGALRELGITAEVSGRNDLIVEGKKVSGNAQHVFKNRVLHHGTLLFNSDLNTLGNAIRVIPGAYTGKAVQSKRSIVANICDFLSRPVTISSFITHLLEYQLSCNRENRVMDIPDNERKEISAQAETKFKTTEWTFFYSPAYTFHRATQFPSDELTVHLEVEKGMIRSARLTGSRFSQSAASHISRLLESVPHLFEEVALTLQNGGIAPEEELVYAFF